MANKIEINLTHKECSSLERWNRLKLWSYCYYRPTDAIPLAKKGMIEILGWSDGNGEKRGTITWGETPPARYLLRVTGEEPHRPLIEAWDTHARRGHGEVYGSMVAVVKLTQLGRDFIHKYGETWRSHMVNNKGPKDDPLILLG